jgi:hypothetical protein
VELRKHNFKNKFYKFDSQKAPSVPKTFRFRTLRTYLNPLVRVTIGIRLTKSRQEESTKNIENIDKFNGLNSTALIINQATM